MLKETAAIFHIKIDGKTIDNHSQVNRINVVLHSDQESVASVLFLAYPGHQGTVDFPVDVTEDSILEIALGYKNSNDSKTVFKGEVSALEMRIEEQTGAVFILNAISDLEFQNDEESVLPLSYGENMLEFDGIVHLDEGKVGESFPREVELRIHGTTQVTPESRITISECNPWFDGDYEVLTVNHQVSDGNWLTQLVVTV